MRGRLKDLLMSGDGLYVAAFGGTGECICESGALHGVIGLLEQSSGCRNRYVLGDAAVLEEFCSDMQQGDGVVGGENGCGVVELFFVALYLSEQAVDARNDLFCQIDGAIITFECVDDILIGFDAIIIGDGFEVTGDERMQGSAGIIWQ